MSEEQEGYELPKIVTDERMTSGDVALVLKFDGGIEIRHNVFALREEGKIKRGKDAVSIVMLLAMLGATEDEENFKRLMHEATARLETSAGEPTMTKQ